jgi:microcystin-dependent protein
MCDGAELEIAGNEDLYATIGTAYGGDGETTFALPDLRGRAPLHRGQRPGSSAYALGAKGGVEGVALTVQQLPAHTHGFQASSNPGASSNPAGHVMATTGAARLFREATPTALLAAVAVAAVGASDSHENRMPFVAINYVVATGPDATSGDGPFVGEIRLASFDTVPAGWARCDGQLLPIEQNPVLFSVVSTMYGGDGESTFALPDVRGSVVIGSGPGDTSEYFQGTAGGAAGVALDASELPAHAHRVRANLGDADLQGPGPTNALARAELPCYQTNASTGIVTMGSATIAPAGSGASHNNRQPFITLSYLIALEGEIPVR